MLKRFNYNNVNVIIIDLEGIDQRGKTLNQMNILDIFSGLIAKIKI